jgi:flagellum-specific ATP synthase
MVGIDGLRNLASIGDRVGIRTRAGSSINAEIVGFRDNAAQAMPFGELSGIGPGHEVRLLGAASGELAVDDAWLGRVVDPMGQPVDGKGPIISTTPARPVRAAAPPAAQRSRLGDRLDFGVAAIDLFTPCRQGQRLGLFAGSGIGKSTLLAMLARGTVCDVVVLGMVGERGREVREFIEDDLGPEGLARSVVVVATSDAPPLMRRQAAHAAMTIAEAFRDQGLSVLLLMDSVTRFCLAQREIGLSVGEPPATRGYPPSVFAELPRLLERAGPGRTRAASPAGHITALFSVLVEGDDHNEPIADAVRGILDGHVILDRRIADSGRYPAIDVLRSLSRAATGILSADETEATRRARRVLAVWEDAADLVRLGAYRAGSDPAVDEALVLVPRLWALLSQSRDQPVPRDQAFSQLMQILRS